jgi:hypothetical protein
MGGIIGAIGGALGGFFKGGVFGMAAQLVQKWLNNKESAKEKEKEIELARLAVKLAETQGNANAIVETLKANAAAQTASYDHDSKNLNIGAGITAFFDGDNKNRSGFAWFVALVLFAIAFALDFIRGSLRPFMCYIYTGFAAAIVWYAYRMGWISQEVIQRCAEYTIYAWVETSGAIIGWYFASRNDEKVKRK